MARPTRFNVARPKTRSTRSGDTRQRRGPLALFHNPKATRPVLIVSTGLIYLGFIYLILPLRNWLLLITYAIFSIPLGFIFILLGAQQEDIYG